MDPAGGCCKIIFPLCRLSRTTPGKSTLFPDGTFGEFGLNNARCNFDLLTQMKPRVEIPTLLQVAADK
jgi:hypothetical protein